MIISNKQQLPRKEPKRTKSKGGNHGYRYGAEVYRPSVWKLGLMRCEGAETLTP